MGLPTQVDESTVKRLQADLRKLTKIYQSVPVEFETDPITYQHAYPGLERWTEARRIFDQFQRNLKEWVYGVLIQHREGDKDSPAQRAVRERAWDLLPTLSVDTLFPTQWSSRLDRYEAAPWTLAKQRDTNIRRYQKKFREFITPLEALVEGEGGVVQRDEPAKHFELYGMTVVIHALNRAGRDGGLDSYLNGLRRQARAIARAGLKDALQGLTHHIRFDEHDGRGGEYDQYRDEVTVFPMGFSSERTFTHEVGHRYWFMNMTNRARAHWERMLSTQQVRTTAEDVALFMDNVWQPDATEAQHLSLIERSSFDPEQKAKFRYFAEHWPAYTWTKDGVKEHHLKFNLNEPVLIEHISDYGATSPIEAFAEAFAHYVTKGPRALGPWTRSFFERLVTRGKLASAVRVLGRFAANTASSCNGLYSRQYRKDVFQQ